MQGRQWAQSCVRGRVFRISPTKNRRAEGPPGPNCACALHTQYLTLFNKKPRVLLCVFACIQLAKLAVQSLNSRFEQAVQS
jgi:hypothetical protein